MPRKQSLRQAGQVHLCPTYDEMARRFAAKARSSLYSAHVGGPKGRQHAEDAAVYARIAKSLASKATLVLELSR